MHNMETAEHNMGTSTADGSVPQSSSSPALNASQTTANASSSNVPTQPTPFLMFVPDYIMADKSRFLGSSPRIKRGRPRKRLGMIFALHQAVIVQKAATVILADIVLGQIQWGGDRGKWPNNWRQTLVQLLAVGTKVPSVGILKVRHREADGERDCPSVCPLHDSGHSHHHLEVTIRGKSTTQVGDGAYFLGELDIFADMNGGYDWTPTLEDEDVKKGKSKSASKDDGSMTVSEEIRALKRWGMIGPLYFPIALFGTGPRIGLLNRQVNLLLVITEELTRKNLGAKTDRPDRAAVMTGGANSSSTVASCPFLKHGVRYVGFNGNGRGKRLHLRGRGYKLAIWMKRAGYRSDEDDPTVQDMRRFLQT